ncbi:MAG TPA: glutamate racemase [Blastocatellia bacterium]|nr:glutamate racemase [Blastocatellia bacterium]
MSKANGSDLDHRITSIDGQESGSFAGTNRKSAIGIFDSGVGGLTVFHAVQRRLPAERLIYLGDTARIPYGVRSAATIERYSLECARFVQSRGVKAIVIACNTASALAANYLRSKCSVPVMGVIRAGARCAVERTSNGRIGVIATEATVASGAYERAIRDLKDGLQITSRACPLFVPLAEEGWLNHPVTFQVAEEYLAQLREVGVDTLVLGCTHYPILRPVIERTLGDRLSYVDSGEAVAETLALLLEEQQLSSDNDGQQSEEFYVTDSADRFRRVAELFLGRQLEAVETVNLGKL